MMKQFFLRERRNLDFLLAFIAQNWEAMSKTKAPMAVTLTDLKPKRSTQANKRHWAILNQISEEGWLGGRQYSAENWHRFFCGEFIGKEELPGGGFTYISSTTLDEEEFAILDHKIEAYAGNLLGLRLVDLNEPIGRIS